MIETSQVGEGLCRDLSRLGRNVPAKTRARRRLSKNKDAGAEVLLVGFCDIENLHLITDCISFFFSIVEEVIERERTGEKMIL